MGMVGLVACGACSEGESQRETEGQGLTPAADTQPCREREREREREGGRQNFRPIIRA